MRAVLLALSVVLMGSISEQPVRITSAYTKLDLERCARVDRLEEPQSARWRCNGLKGVPLFVQNGDDRYDVDAGREDEDELWGEGFDYPGRTVEWRLSSGMPFAIIYRLNSAAVGSLGGSRLMVETIGRESPGCRIASINARAKRANEKARRAADGILSGTVRCLTS